MPVIHQNLAAGRWAQMTLSQQLANVGSEFMRWQSQKDPVLKQAAQDRMLELLDLTIKAHPGAAAKELGRLRESVCQPQHTASLKKYFMDFALSARKI
ncbi:MAG: hypothetical protein A3J07_03820 [Candidatus Doudnabacteria bacterium RIFCSPLOWO2_02_FULL_49_13]|uniref:Uncharacterized protein n=1 Tax=Candidatus Doudnabacteria bacterium RIFCSPHIGHO2_12_FULL_48_16 TaxID=1817838 RepID=A0A1F5PJC1_9BACT|nr:MAG: hypothetical protein A3B77_02630 [Candidatus Doudnabacteria bacterium RIFCSPHIGHO2_02_FULL_49_24]OGE89602.1 MAG: hypothetical protein A2760_03835 [Candidatus Doudnabacteria bacterium RIFCSPHIGHO2_01_FULL_50_67]OGE90045.1 MAG: hypothetical protein A3E29_02965 [Candidatus Doudnabacteria bacterium RIFCSPHIGHO2_12_FULL_48_16]OGE96618.1 MAG: hypothetical protein A2990_00275 [Candidatus Doudnabacteria bacterium RIFCSPLOWO2_01_FULL_49_40]OGF03188.1 MAG: hypothetical protein A3J07_03820 [Candid